MMQLLREGWDQMPENVFSGGVGCFGLFLRFLVLILWMHFS